MSFYISAHGLLLAASFERSGIGFSFIQTWGSGNTKGLTEGIRATLERLYVLLRQQQ